MIKAEDKKKKSASSVESLLPLSALQLPYWVHLTREPGADQVQARFRVSGVDSTSRLQEAWADTQRQFQCLRATVNIAPNQQPVLVIRKTVDSHFTVADWSGLTTPEQEKHIAEFLAADRQNPLSIDKAPSSKLFCAKLSKDTLYCVWTCHHLLLDGWSSAVVVNRLLFNYHHRLQRGIPVRIPSKSPEYADYRNYLEKQPKRPSQEYWRKTLQGFNHPTLISNHRNAGTSSRSQRQLSESASKELNQFCKANALTFGTVVQTAWALTCANHLNRDDVVFGLVTHGRSLDLAGVDQIVGLLSNVTPVRARFESEQPLTRWAALFQTEQFEARLHEHLSLNEVLSLSEPATRTQAFDSVLAIEALPTIQPVEFNEPAISDYASDTISGFPVSVTVAPAEQIEISIDIQNDHHGDSLAETLLDQLQDILTRIPAMAQNSSAVFLTGKQPSADLIASKQTFQIRNAGLRNIVNARNEFELQVLSLWEDVLQIYPLSMDSNFFACGGNSLGVLRLLANIKDTLGKEVSLAHFIENPTVISMCDYINDDKQNKPIKSLVLLRKGLENKNLFCLHAGGGHALFYRPLALRLDNSFSVYALQPSGLGGETVPSESVSDMVDSYLEEITTVQPHGPYNLLCYCFGAALTLEIINKLQARGEDAGHVIIADAVAPIPASHPMSGAGWRAYVLYELVAQQQYKSTLYAARNQLTRWLEPVTRSRPNRFDSTETDAANVTPPNAAVDDANSGAMAEHSIRGHSSKVQTACERAFHKYRATPCNSHVHILRSDSSKRRTPFDVFMRHWQTLAPSQTEHLLDETHADIMSEPFVANTAALVNSIIEK